MVIVKERFMFFRFFSLCSVSIDRRSGCIFVLVGFLISGCLPSRDIVEHIRTEYGYCHPASSYSLDSVNYPVQDIFSVADSAMLSCYSYKALLAANATGVLKELKDLYRIRMHMQQDTSFALKLRYNFIQQEIQMKVLLVSTEIMSMAAELDCEGERAEQVAAYLSEQENHRVKRLTALSIITGALAASAATLISKPHYTASEEIAVVGGMTSALLGLATLLSSRHITYLHERNLLSDIWYGPARSHIYPPSVWYMLNEKAFSNNPESSAREIICQRWKHYGLVEENASRESQRLQKLYFNNGGKYEADELQARADMLNQMQAAVRLMHQDLQMLIFELYRFQEGCIPAKR